MRMNLHENSTVKMKDLPKQERPYEKCARFGPETLSDAELLAVILRSGAEGVSVLEMSRSLIHSLGSGGIAMLPAQGMEDLQKIRGIGAVKALQIRCLAELSRRIAQAKIGAEDELVYDNPEVIGSYYMEELRHESQEIVLILCLSSKGRLLGKKIISRGTIHTAILDPGEVFKEALARRAASIVLLHNHPSGDPTPSGMDKEITERICKAGQILGIQLIDHLIIGDLSFTSLRECGCIPEQIPAYS